MHRRIFFCRSFFSFSLLFAAVIDLLLGLLEVKKLLTKGQRDGQFLAWSSPVWWQVILLWVFHSTFWAFLCISKAPFGQSLWSEHYWKYLFLLQKLRIDGTHFGQKWWRQKRKKGQYSSRAVTGGTGVNGLTSQMPDLGYLNFEFSVFFKPNLKRSIFDKPNLQFWYLKF